MNGDAIKTSITKIFNASNKYDIYKVIPQSL